ncbi:MAG: tetratricopeptide repeat protein [bacterium]|nr:tetratricopeptide repeat protein [bacterium]
MKIMYRILIFTIILLLIFIIINLVHSGLRCIQTSSVIHQGDRYIAKGMYPEAINAYKKAERIKPNSFFIHYKLATAYNKARMYPESIEEFNKGINLNPKDKRIKDGLNVLLKEQNMLIDRCYQQALSSFNSNKLGEAKRILENGLKLLGKNTKLCELLKSVENKLLTQSVSEQQPISVLAKTEVPIPLPIEKREEDSSLRKTKPSPPKKEISKRQMPNGVTVISNPITANIPSDVIVAIYDKEGSIYDGAWWVSYDNENRSKTLIKNYTPITIHFKSTDPFATLPPVYTFKPPESCIHTFEGLIFRTPGTHILTAIATEDGRSWITGVDKVIVYPAGKGADHFHIVDISNPIKIGEWSNVSIVVHDVEERLVVNYTGSVQFTSTDPKATLPANYTFSGSDYGLHTFVDGVRFYTQGEQRVIVTDNNITGTSDKITVLR